MLEYPVVVKVEEAAVKIDVVPVEMELVRVDEQTGLGLEQYSAVGGLWDRHSLRQMVASVSDRNLYEHLSA
jgi:hypothetical protein